MFCIINFFEINCLYSLWTWIYDYSSPLKYSAFYPLYQVLISCWQNLGINKSKVNWFNFVTNYPMDSGDTSQTWAQKSNLILEEFAGLFPLRLSNRTCIPQTSRHVQSIYLPNIFWNRDHVLFQRDWRKNWEGT